MADEIRILACRKNVEPNDPLYDCIVECMIDHGIKPTQGRIILITEKNTRVGKASARKGAKKRAR